MTTDATTQTATERLKERYLDIELEIEDRAKTNGHFAIAHALLRLTEMLDDRLGDLTTATSSVGDAIIHAADSLSPVADAIEHIDVGGQLDRLADAVEALKSPPAS